MFRIRKTDSDRQIVYGEVYVPDEVDSHGEMMLAEDIESMAHHFLKEATLGKAIDTQHNNWPNGSYPVESFIARGHKEWVDGAWVMGVKVPDARLWARIKKGEIAGFSFEGLAKKQKAVVALTYRKNHIGYTEPDPKDGHVHAIVVKMDKMGKIVGGSTGVVNGHSHTISRGSATDTSKGHRHRFFLKTLP